MISLKMTFWRGLTSLLYERALDREMVAIKKVDKITLVMEEIEKAIFVK